MKKEIMYIYSLLSIYGKRLKDSFAFLDTYYTVINSGKVFNAIADQQKQNSGDLQAGIEVSFQL
ncbi:hypothetical protein KDA_63190 [Dictyobacter alpinus]|uniref:Uncharacterized protein n=1 Tax=Dictyobacter alpinus TaxID=2014873 RepID=A0A402BHJ3_9CHLR|nr:hypothetical protein [Dictyobacter alpinus]GCE30835.1 hypothetical protein KDA_63190 [Dictyobacter alpinus]